MDKMTKLSPLGLKEGDIFSLRKPWWKFWFTPWNLRVVKDKRDNSWWLVDPCGAWYANLGDYSIEEFVKYYKPIYLK